MTIGPVTVSHVGDSIVGRVLFGAGGLLGAAIAVVAWRRALRPRDRVD